MIEMKKTLIVVYKDELLMNQLKKLVETCDDTEQSIIGTKDNSINIISWTEKVWLDNKAAGNIQGKILFLGNVKGTDKLIPVIDVKFDDCGVKFGWAGNQAIVFADTHSLKDRKHYDVFLNKLSNLPVPDFLKTEKEEITATGTCQEKDSKKDSNVVAEKEDNARFGAVNVAKKAVNAGVNGVEKLGDRVATKSEEIFRDKFLMKRQMLFYGVINLYNDGLEEFMNL